MNNLKSILPFGAVLYMVFIASCSKKSDTPPPPQISAEGYFTGSATNTAMTNTFPMTLLNRADGSVRIYQLNANSTSFDDTAHAAFKLNGNWTLSGNVYDAVIPTIEFKATLAAPVTKIEGNFSINGVVQGTFSVTKKQ